MNIYCTIFGFFYAIFGWVANKFDYKWVGEVGRVVRKLIVREAKNCAPLLTAKKCTHPISPETLNKTKNNLFQHKIHRVFSIDI